MACYLSLKEIWRNRGRFLLFSLVIALITVLVLFVAALGEGLGAGNREYIEKLQADLIVYDAKAELLIGSSRIPQSKLNSIRRVPGVAAAGPIGFSNVSIEYPGGAVRLKVALIGVEPGAPGEPTVLQGGTLAGQRGKEAIIDRNVALRTGLKVGDLLTVHATQGSDENSYPLRVVGISSGQQYMIQPSLIVPYRTWDRIRPQASAPSDDPTTELVANVVAVRLAPGVDLATAQARLAAQVRDIQAADRATAYQATPGYTAQQSTLNTQKYFALLIGVLVIGGFFQIQTLQKVPQIGMLKAIGAANATVALASILQITLVTILGVGIGSAGTLLLSLSFPPTVPIVFSVNSVLAAIISLLLIGPLGGLVSIHYSTRIEPLTALGLAS